MATPDKIKANKPLLPADIRYVVIQGGIHSYFGEYGHQPGDGEAAISRESARAQILSQTIQFLQNIH